MRNLFRQTYRTASHRKSSIDYASPGRYFVTVCTADRDTAFGEIRNGIMGLNDAGCIVADEIEHTPMVRPYVAIDDWIVMPDHVHMIVTIRPSNPDARNAHPVETHRRCVSTSVGQCIPLCRRRPHTLGSIIAQWKSICTKRIHAMGHANFACHVARVRRGLAIKLLRPDYSFRQRMAPHSPIHRNESPTMGTGQKF